MRKDKKRLSLGDKMHEFFLTTVPDKEMRMPALVGYEETGKGNIPVMELKSLELDRRGA